jgi:NAD(P)-dependent dehydrogenase (short-subunit alcohol dehydrogenase family)
VKPLLEVDIEDAKRVFDINFFAAFEILQAAARVMVERERGAIVNVISRLASVGLPRVAVYGSTKGALLALTRHAAIELAPKGVRVNAVAPGMIRIPDYENWLAKQDDPDGVLRQHASTVPQRRLAWPDDVAAAIAYLASDDAAHVTGASLAVDGGYTAA